MKQRLLLLIALYESELENIKDRSFEKAFEYLLIAELHQGICHANKIRLNRKHGEIILYKEPIINEHCKYKDRYWCIIPFQCKTIEEIVKSMQFRISKMLEIVNTL